MPRRYQIPKPVGSPVATGLQQGFIFPTAQPSDRWFTRSADLMRTQSPAAPLAVQQGPSVQASSVFPQRISWAKLGGLRSLRGPGLPLIGPDIQPQTYEFLVSQPNLAAYLRITESRRFPYDVVPQIQQGATVTQQFVKYEPTVPITDYYIRRAQVATVLPIGGVPAAPGGTFQPPPDATLTPTGPRYTVMVLRRTIKGPAIPLQNPLYVLDQPVTAWYTVRDPNRLIGPALVPQGPTLQATYVFPLDQPESIRWRALRPQPDVTVRTEGVIASQHFIIPATQPDRAAWYLPQTRFDVTKQLTGVFTPPAAAQTYVFEPGQPSRTFWYVPRVAAVPQGPPIQTTGPPSLRTDPIPKPTIPERSWWQPGPAPQMFVMTIPTVDFRAAWVRFNTYVGPWTQEPE